MKLRLGFVCGLIAVLIGLLTVAATAHIRSEGPFGINEDQHPFKNDELLAADEARDFALCGFVLCAVASVTAIVFARRSGSLPTENLSIESKLGLTGLLVSAGLLAWTVVTYVQDGIDYMISF